MSITNTNEIKIILVKSILIAIPFVGPIMQIVNITAKKK